MVNPFKKAQKDSKESRLIKQCKALYDQGAVGKHRAIVMYAKAMGVSHAEAKVKLE